MDKYFSPDICKERIEELFQPLMNYWTLYELKQKNGAITIYEEKTLIQCRTHAISNHEDMLHFLSHFPIDGDRYTLLLIYEKVFSEITALLPDEKYDCFYLCEKFISCLLSSKY